MCQQALILTFDYEIKLSVYIDYLKPVDPFIALQKNMNHSYSSAVSEKEFIYLKFKKCPIP